MAETTFHATMAMANALAYGEGEDVRVDMADVRAFLQTQKAEESVRREFLTERQEHFIRRALDFLLSDDGPRA